MIITLRDVNKTYPGVVPLHVLKDINLEIARGELVSIMGASGSGKSTLLNILGILDNYDSGDYRLDGVEIRNLSENRAAELRNKLIGFVFQSFNLIGYKNALENVALPLYYQGMSRKKRNLLAMEQLERLGLADPPPIFRASSRADRSNASPLPAPLSPNHQSSLPTNPPAPSTRIPQKR